MTIQAVKQHLLQLIISSIFLVGVVVGVHPVSAQVFYFNPTNTPAPSPTAGVTATPSATILLNATTTLTPPVTGTVLSITPTGPVRMIVPAENKRGVYVDNATDTTVIRDGNTVYVGGSFTEVQLATGSAVLRTRLAAIDTVSKEVLPWDPAPNARVEILEVDPSTIYVGGQFTQIAGQTRNYLAAFDKQSYVLTSWDPNANDIVNALHSDADRTYVGGRFTAISNQNRERIAAFTKPNNILDPSFIVNANAEVYTMEGNDTTLYVGGRFTEIGGKPRNYLAAIDKKTGIVTDWNPQLNDVVRRISFSNGQIVVNGPFTQVNGDAVSYAATIDPVTGKVTSVQPLNAQGTPVPVTNTTINSSIMVDQAALGFRIPNLAEVLTFAIRMFFIIAGLLALFYLLFAAFEWITSGGDEEKTGAAQKKMTAAVIGVILIVVVLAIVVTLEQIVFRGRICFGLSCAASIPSLIQPLDEELPTATPSAQ